MYKRCDKDGIRARKRIVPNSSPEGNAPARQGQIIVGTVGIIAVVLSQNIDTYDARLG